MTAFTEKNHYANIGAKRKFRIGPMRKRKQSFDACHKSQLIPILINL